MVEGTVEQKRCIKCGKLKPIDDFYVRQNGKRHNQCKRCILDAQKKYYQQNKEKQLEYRKEYYKKNRETERKKQSEYVATHKQEKHEYDIKRYQENKEEIQRKNYKRYKERRETDELFDFICKMRSLIGSSFKRKDIKKDVSTAEILGCSIQEAQNYLEQTWINNYGYPRGNEAYHIDHIIPLAMAKSREDVIQLCHISNLQLLKPADNIRKRDSIPEGLKELLKEDRTDEKNIL